MAQEELIEILVFLSDDLDGGVAGQARQTLAAYPEDVIRPLLASSFTAEPVFEYFSRPAVRSRVLLETIILNTAAPDSLILRLADQVEAALIDAILINLMRLLRTPEILFALENNSNNTPDTRRRLGEIRLEFFDKRNTFVPVTPFSMSESVEESTAAEEVEESTQVEKPLTTHAPADAVVHDTAKLIEEDGETLPTERLTTLQRIAQMTVAERVQSAIKGSKDERLILIRDSNKVVSRAVVQSPKLSENEVEWFAQMRNVNEEVLRLIGISRTWSKSYGIIHNLIRNARAPLSVTLPMLKRLMTRDLKALARNRGVPEVLRRTAQKQVQLREQGSASQR